MQKATGLVKRREVIQRGIRDQAQAGVRLNPAPIFQDLRRQLSVIKDRGKMREPTQPGWKKSGRHRR